MVDGIGSNLTGSIKETIVYQTYYKMYQEAIKKGDCTVSFEAWLQATGKRAYFTQQIENYLETGNENYGDDTKDTLNIGRHITSGDGGIYQSEDEETFYQFDWDSGTYTILEGKEAAAKAMGLPDDVDVDTLTLGFQKAQITNYTFGNLDDGQQSSMQVLNGAYSGVTYVNQEFDPHYILNALYMDPTDPQYNIAKGIFDDLCANINQWLPESEQIELDSIATEYGTDSVEYKDALKDAILRNLDQANEWVEEHGHVENVNSGTLTNPEDIYNDGTVNGDSTENEETPIPEYDKTNVIEAAGLSDDYRKHYYGSWHYKDGQERDSAKSDALAYVDQLISTLISTMASQMGEKYTKEIEDYAIKAKQAILDKPELAQSYEGKGGSWFKDYGARADIDNKAVIDAFFSEFDSMCANNGKTSEQVAADQKAQEEKAAAEKDSYQYFYNMNFSEIATEAGVKDTQAVNVSSAAEIKAKAESDILEPLMIRIKAKLSGKNIPDSDLKAIFEYATQNALANPNDWASTTNNVVYNINSEKVVSLFESAVKEAIKAKGYNF